MVFGFTHGQQTSELVSNNYYEDELQYQEVIDGKNNAQQLTEIPKYRESEKGINITFVETELPTDKKVRFELYRTDDANLDIKKELTLDSENSFLIPIKVISKGPYTLKLKWSKVDKPYQVDYDVLWK